MGASRGGGQSLPSQAPPAPGVPARTASKPRHALLCLRCTEGSDFSTSRAKSKMRTKSSLKLPVPCLPPVVNGGRERDLTSSNARTPEAEGSVRQEGPHCGVEIGATDVWLPPTHPPPGSCEENDCRSSSPLPHSSSPGWGLTARNKLGSHACSQSPWLKG